MELLLFLSALLTALTGAISGVRAPEAQVHQACGTTVGAPASATARAAPIRSVRTWLTLARGLTSPAARSLHTGDAAPALFAAIPLYLDKPRE